MNEEKILLAAIKKSLFGISVKDDFVNDDIDWNIIIKESVQQTVSTIVFDGLAELKEYIPPDIYMNWLRLSMNKMRSNDYINKHQNELIELLTDNKISCTIIKGITAAYNYPKPEMRILGDIDFIIEPENIETVRELLLSNGYEAHGTDTICHATFVKNNVIVEMHNEINGIPNGIPGEVIRNHLKDLISLSETVNLENERFSMAPVHIQGFIFILHMIHHLLESGFGLRHLCDWAMFVHNRLNEDIWINQYVPTLKNSGIYDFTNAVIWTCVNYLGLPAVNWMVPVDDDICDSIMNDILKSGNFGRKDPARAKSGTMAFNSKEYNDNHTIVYKYHRVIKKLAYAHWSLIEKIPALIIFAYIYFPIWYILMMIRGKRPVMTPKQLINDVNERNDIYKKLSIFKIDK